MFVGQLAVSCVCGKFGCCGGLVTCGACFPKSKLVFCVDCDGCGLNGCFCAGGDFLWCVGGELLYVLCGDLLDACGGVPCFPWSKLFSCLVVLSYLGVFSFRVYLSIFGEFFIKELMLVVFSFLPSSAKPKLKLQFWLRLALILSSSTPTPPENTETYPNWKFSLYMYTKHV